MKKQILNLPPDGLTSVPAEDRPRIRLGLLTAAGKTYRDLANITGQSATYMGQIINDERTGYKFRPVIARVLGYPVVALWPDTPPQYREAA